MSVTFLGNSILSEIAKENPKLRTKANFFCNQTKSFGFNSFHNFVENLETCAIIKSPKIVLLFHVYFTTAKDTKLYLSFLILLFDFLLNNLKIPSQKIFFILPLLRDKAQLYTTINDICAERKIQVLNCTSITSSNCRLHCSKLVPKSLIRKFCKLCSLITENTQSHKQFKFSDLVLTSQFRHLQIQSDLVSSLCNLSF